MAPNGGERLRATELVVHALGEVITEVLDEIRSWPWWSFNRKRRWVAVGKLTVGCRIYNDWVTLSDDDATA